MCEQPWRRFVLLLSFSNRYRELRVHMYDRSGGLVSPSFNINTNPDAYLQVLGAIAFGIPECLGYDQTIVFYVTPSARTSNSRRTAKTYDIVQVLFYSRGLTGRGTVCYLARFKNKEFIIKDHWVQGEDSQDVLNEVEMLKRMQGVPGVPRLEDYWVVQRGDGTPDITSELRFKLFPSTSNSYRTHVRLVLTPCARPLHEFRSKRELVTALHDIVSSRYFFIAQGPSLTDRPASQSYEQHPSVILFIAIVASTTR
ncbi:hypothetical protein DEU56DRAFT_745757 [Suillus clintonianus]|uniref:uncharacterized protein n=1 Tax=Suillus clintonianus TaxID=1904413 RepID=UPI001B87CC5D|nr:uncharacterized protein DEU56DRAFT_745757 [Suillus clintonianus]KAG2122772.1 hypothetical protein DEU56DRAFT_745757 [Suillus clintonianus]